MVLLVVVLKNWPLLKVDHLVLLIHQWDRDFLCAKSSVENPSIALLGLRGRPIYCRVGEKRRILLEVLHKHHSELCLKILDNTV